jgi:hypothetical protein
MECVILVGGPNCVFPSHWNRVPTAVNKPAQCNALGSDNPKITNSPERGDTIAVIKSTGNRVASLGLCLLVQLNQGGNVPRLPWAGV